MEYPVRVAAQSDEPAIKCVDALFADAIHCAASDIHLESTSGHLRVRYRIDGILHDRAPIDVSLKPLVLSRIKVLAHIDITEKRMPQDGQVCVPYAQRRVDLRIATFPALHGEKIVVRILDRSRIALDLTQLGMHDDILAALQLLIGKPQGFFLVTGPTGSGKTTTLYAALAALNTPEKHIITLEDPVEYDIPGITQGRVNVSIGFTFERGIRSLLRQDPDVVMVGEIRDKETAQTAIEAALTGHMVLSTLHTNDAASAIVRLVDMGIDPFLISAALTGVLAQRLARVICRACRVAYSPHVHELLQSQSLGQEPAVLYKGVGCENCAMQGYKGRTGIFELMVIDDTLRELVVRRTSLNIVREYAVRNGMRRLVHDGYAKVCDGTSTLSELLRVVT